MGTNLTPLTFTMTKKERKKKMQIQEMDSKDQCITLRKNKTEPRHLSLDFRDRQLEILLVYEDILCM